MRRAEVERNRPQARRTREKRGCVSPRSGPLVSPRKMPKGPETMPATGKGTSLDSPGGRTGTWKVALVQVRGGQIFSTQTETLFPATISAATFRFQVTCAPRKGENGARAG